MPIGESNNLIGGYNNIESESESEPESNESE